MTIFESSRREVLQTTSVALLGSTLFATRGAAAGANFELTAVGNPYHVRVDDPISISATIENTGDAAATQDVAIYGDTMFGRILHDSESVTLGPGEDTSVVLKVPSGGSNGIYSLVYETADDSRSFNVIVGDLDAVTFENVVAPDSVEVGRAFDVGLTVNNNVVENAFEPELELVVDDGNGGITVDTRQLTLDPSTSRAVELTYRPDTVPSGGTFDWTVQLPNESASGSADVLEVPDDPTDFQIVGVAAPNQVPADEPIDFEVTLENAGSGTGTETVTLYTETISEKILADQTDVTLTPGERSTVVLTISNDSTSHTGVYDYLVETDNDAASGSVLVGDPDHVHIVDVDAPAAVEVGSELAVDVTLENTGLEHTHTLQLELVDEASGARLGATDVAVEPTGETTATVRHVPAGAPADGTLSFVVRTETASATGSVEVFEDAAGAVTYEADLLPGQADLVEVTISLTLSEDAVADLGELRWNIDVPNNEVVESDGIVLKSDVSDELLPGNFFVWDGERTEASLTVRYGPTDSHRYEVTDTWAFLKIKFTAPEDVTIRESARDGVRGENHLFFGPHETYRETARGQEVVLVVPDAANMDASPQAVLDHLVFCAREVRVGARAPTCHAFTKPGGMTGFGVDSDLGVSDSSGVPGSWGHEYFHTRQVRIGSSTASSATWLIEAEAEWFEHLMAFRDDLIAWSDIWTSNRLGPDSAPEDIQLSERSTWENPQQYHKGGLVLAALDGRMRRVTNGAVTYQDLARELNERAASEDFVIDMVNFVDIAESLTGASFADFADSYIHGTEVPDPPDRALFVPGETPLGWGTYEIANADAPAQIPVEGPLSVDVTVENTADVDGRQVVKLGNQDPAGGLAEVHASRELALTAGEQRTITLTHQMESRTAESPPDVFTWIVETADDSATGVTDAGDVEIFSISDISAPASVETDEAITVEATVNGGVLNGKTRTQTVRLVDRSDGSTVDAVDVTLDPLETRTVTLTRAAAQNVGGEPFEFTVETDGDTATGSVDVADDGGSGDTGSGDGDDEDCFITTATANDVGTLDSLRRFRDESMSATPVGRALVWLYYRISPPIADTLERNPDSRTANATRSIVERCAMLSDRQDATDARLESALLGVRLTLLYAVGILVGAVGHGAIRASELSEDRVE